MMIVVVVVVVVAIIIMIINSNNGRDQHLQRGLHLDIYIYIERER